MKAQNERPTIGFFTNEIYYPLFAQLVWLGVTDAAHEHGANVICFVGESLEDPREFKAQGNILFDLVSGERIDGLILWSGALDWHVGQEKMEKFIKRYTPLPVISLESTFEGITSILMDNYHGMREVMTHLIEVHGYRRIAHIRGPENHFGAREIYRAYSETLTEAGLSYDANLVTPPANWGQKAGSAMMELLLDERGLRPQVDIEAIVACDDDLALGAMKVLQARGIQIPDDIAIVGHDDDQEGEFDTPPLTTVRPPFYEMGWQATELALALLRGEHVAERVILPTKAIVRQSCGCVAPAVAQVTTGSVPKSVTDTPFEVALTERREVLLAAMLQAVDVTAVGEATDWAERLLDGFMAELKGEATGRFLSTLEEILRQVVAENGDVTSWHGVISELRHQTLPYLSEEALSRADVLWHQARIVIGDTAQRAQAYQASQAKQKAQTLRELGARLISTFDVTELGNVLAEGLPRLCIPSVYLSLYENPPPYKYPQLAPEWSRLILAYDEQGRVELQPGGQRFLSRYLVPEELLPQKRSYNIVIEPLYFREEQIGFVLFEVGPRDGSVYEALRGEISSALQGDLLIQQVQERTVDLDLAHARIRSLNKRLKEQHLGVKKISLQELAKLAGVSTTTASAVLNNRAKEYRIRPETQRKVKELAKRFNYTPNRMARGLSRKKTQTIGLVVPDLSHWFFSQLFGSLQSIILESGYRLYTTMSNYDEHEEYKALNDLLAWRIDGLIVASIMKHEQVPENFLQSQVPLVYVNRQIESDHISWVASNNRKAAYKLVSYLCSTGVQEICYLGGDSTISTFQHRLGGYCQALEDQKIHCNPDLIFEQGMTSADGYQLMKILVQQHGFPEAIFAASCEFMLGLLRFLKDEVKTIPSNLKIGTYDNHALLDLLPIKIPSVQQDTDRMARAAFELLTHAINGERHLQHQVIPAQLIIRS